MTLLHAESNDHKEKQRVGFFFKTLNSTEVGLHSKHLVSAKGLASNKSGLKPAVKEPIYVKYQDRPIRYDGCPLRPDSMKVALQVLSWSPNSPQEMLYRCYAKLDYPGQ